MAEKKVSEEKLFVAEPYEALPCELAVFLVKGKKAYSSDFGYGGDCGEKVGDDEIDRWGCSDYVWKRDLEGKHETMQEYGITSEEYDTICDALEEILHVGTCGWCV